MDYPWATEFGKLARRRRIALSVHAPIAGFMGHVERDRKHAMAVGMLDHSAGIAMAAGAEPVVFHPGFLLERTRKQALAQIVEQLADLRTRLEGKGRGVPFGVEIMGRVREIGSLDDVLHIASRLPWVRPVIDFAHLHAVTDGAFTTMKAFHEVLSAANKFLPRGTHSTSTSRTSPTRIATRRSTCPTARARCARSRSGKRSPASRVRRP